MSISKGFSPDKYYAIVNNVTEEGLLSYYLGVNKLPSLISAPYRVDNKPSLGLFRTNNNKINFRDFANGEGGDIIKLLSKIWNTDFNQTINKIYSDLSNKQTSNVILDKLPSSSVSKKPKILNTSLEVKIREWKSYDLEYWESYGISLPWLEFGDVYPISHIFFTKNRKTTVFPAEKYAYVYIERKDSKVSLKVYQPFSNTLKWLSKHDSSVWDLWTKLPSQGESLIITSSRKDALCIWENTEIPSISLQGEGYIPKNNVVKSLQQRFENIYILYDNDFSSSENHGRIFGNKLSKMFNIPQIEIPEQYHAKDTSDLCKIYGRQKVNEVITSLIKNV